MAFCPVLFGSSCHSCHSTICGSTSFHSYFGMVVFLVYFVCLFVVFFLVFALFFPFVYIPFILAISIPFNLIPKETKTTRSKPASYLILGTEARPLNQLEIFRITIAASAIDRNNQVIMSFAIKTQKELVF